MPDDHGLESIEEPEPEPEPVCGNGEVEADERCDDANEDDYDGCYSSCVRPVVSAWSHYLESTAERGALLFDPQGDLFVLDFVGFGGFYRLGVVQFSGSGDERWDWVDVGGALGRPEGMARRPDGDLVILSSDNGTVHVVELSPGTDQDPVWIDSIDDESNYQKPVGIDVDQDGAVLIAVPHYAGSRDVELRKYDPAGNLAWTATYDEQLQYDLGYDLFRGPSGETYLLGRTRIDPSSDWDSWISVYDSSGNELARRTIDDRELESGAIDADGNVLIVGAVGGALWITRLTPDLADIEEVLIDAEDGMTAVGYALAVGDSADVYIGGALTPTSDRDFLGLVERREPSLERPRWGQSPRSHRGNWSSVRVSADAIALSPDESQVAVLINDVDSIGSASAKLQVYDNAAPPGL